MVEDGTLKIVSKASGRAAALYARTDVAQPAAATTPKPAPVKTEASSLPVNGIDWNHAVKAIAIAEGREASDVVRDMFVAYVTQAQA